MGNEESSSNTGSSSQVSSLGDYSNKSSFGAAFKDAHARGGNGHTFTYKGTLYNTNCKDGGDYRKTSDNRSNIMHYKNMYGHEFNAKLKDATNGTMNIDVLGHPGKHWNADKDRERAEYHRREIMKNNTKK